MPGKPIRPRNGNAYVIGATNAPNIITPNAFQSTCGACKLGFNSGTQYHAFIMKVNTNASGESSLLDSTYFGGNESDA